MRASLVASGLIFLIQPALAADGYIQLSRPNTGYSAFMMDRNACFSTASHRSYDRNRPVVETRYDLDQFASCMTARGYRLDPNGYRAAWYTMSSDGRHYALLPNGKPDRGPVSMP